MSYNFDELTGRRATGSYKWDSDADPDIIPLWVADMDFRTAPSVTDAVVQRALQGIFGYVSVPDSYYDALVDWFDRKHGWKINRERVIYTSGIVPALSAIIKALVKPGEKVIIQTPAYNCFFSSVRNNGVIIGENTLVREETADGFTYRIDFDNLEKLAAESKLLILCNPHNPSGRVWSRSELERIRDICRKHGVRVVSDEIHCELTLPGYAYIPYANIDSETIVCCSPTKAFNIAGLQIANIVCPDERTQAVIDRAINDNEVCDVNPFGPVALQAAYNKGEDWLDSLKAYLYDNYLLVREAFKGLSKVCNSEATYLAWIDITPLSMTSEEVAAKLKAEAKVRIASGTIYAGEGYIRINYACPQPRLEEALRRIVNVLRGS